MFTGFTKETSDFFWELAFNNERPWFLEHREQFERVLNEPFKALAKETNALMAEKFPHMDCQVHIARIYRDARRLFGRGPYKDHLWFSIKSNNTLLDGPMFWFEIGAAEFSYGMGFYNATAAQMQHFRDIVDSNPAAFERLITDVEKHKEFTLTGEKYSKPKGSHNEHISNWYNRKRLGLEHTEEFGGDALSPELPAILVREYEKLMPMYELFMRFYTEEV